jgi:hypothetical protein
MLLIKHHNIHQNGSKVKIRLAAVGSKNDANRMSFSRPHAARWDGRELEDSTIVKSSSNWQYNPELLTPY